MTTPKTALLANIRSQLGTEFERLSRIVALAAEEASGENSQPEDEMDTLGLEASYIADSQASRLRELQGLVQFYETGYFPHFGADDPIDVGAWVDLDEEGRPSSVFLGPRGGASVRHDGREVRLLASDSPLGRALVGRTVGDVVELETPKGVREIEIVAVR